MSKHTARDSRGRFVSSKPLTVTSDSVTVDPAAESVARLPIVVAPVEETRVTIHDLDGNAEVVDFYPDFPWAVEDALHYMDCGDFSCGIRLDQVSDHLRDYVGCPIGWDFIEAGTEEEGKLMADAVADAIMEGTNEVCPPTCTCCDDEPYAEFSINRDTRRDTYARAMAAVASMPEESKVSRRVKGLLYLVESRTTDTATEAGLQQAVEAANVLEFLAAS